MNKTTKTAVKTVATVKKAVAVKAPKADRPKVFYPFETKKQISAKIATDDSYVRQALVQLHEGHKTNEAGNQFASSHAASGVALATAIVEGRDLTVAETEKARTIVCHYTKRLARHARQVAKATEPELIETAKIFGV